MVRDHLSERMKQGGAALLAATDALAMQAQGAMWLFDHELEDWRFYLVTSLVDTLGRRKTYRLLVEVFESSALPKDLTVEDVYLGSPNDPQFRLIASVFQVKDHSAEFQNVSINNFKFDAVVYRTEKAIPTPQEAASIEKRFAKRVRDLSAALRKHQGQSRKPEVEGGTPNSGRDKWEDLENSKTALVGEKLGRV